MKCSSVLICLLFALKSSTSAASECSWFLGGDFSTKNRPQFDTMTVANSESRKHFIDFVHKYGGTMVASSSDSVENRADVNCHGYSCFVSGLRYSWLESDDFNATLASSFKKIKSYRLAEVVQIESDETLKEGDLVTFSSVDKRIHSGVIVHIVDEGSQKNWVRSKLGKLITADLRPQALSILYGGSPYYSLSEIEIWRKR